MAALTVITGVYGMNFELHARAEVALRLPLVLGADGRRVRRARLMWFKRKKQVDLSEPDRAAPRRPRQQDRGRRGGGAAGLGGQGAGRERARRRRAAASRVEIEAGGKTLHPRARRRPRHGPRGRASGPGAPRHLQAARAGRPAERSPPTASAARPCPRSPASPHLVLRTREDGRRGGTEVEVRHGRLAARARRRPSAGHDGRGARPVRRRARAAQVPARGRARRPAHVAEAVTLLALARPGRRLRRWPRAGAR